ncbi:hypothetical protein CTAYLR_001832 [Chrysophaeum taylorii]|uniref:Uncharacterized protein n=1 Tax=Chrysophaeum taylorii TaxID=2483200 RepID=A0AAD7XG43_9STRA|nr:hypothetical protein CTAYLR_001832 [Chrysophaeum taylorii]
MASIKGFFKSKMKRSASTNDMLFTDMDEVNDLFFAFAEEHCSPRKKGHREVSKLQTPVSNPVARFQLMPGARKRALSPMSSVILYEMLRHDKSVGKAVVEQYEKLRVGGRLFDVTFPEERLGLTLVLARLSYSPRARLLVDETFPSCPGWDRLRPLDELIAINGSLLIPIDMEAFPSLVANLANLARPLELTFAKTPGRALAFRKQQQRRQLTGSNEEAVARPRRNTIDGAESARYYQGEPMVVRSATLESTIDDDRRSTDLPLGGSSPLVESDLSSASPTHEVQLEIDDSPQPLIETAESVTEAWTNALATGPLTKEDEDDDDTVELALVPPPASPERATRAFASASADSTSTTSVQGTREAVSDAWSLVSGNSASTVGVRRSSRDGGPRDGAPIALPLATTKEEESDASDGIPALRQISLRQVSLFSAEDDARPSTPPARPVVVVARGVSKECQTEDAPLAAPTPDLAPRAARRSRLPFFRPWRKRSRKPAPKKELHPDAMPSQAIIPVQPPRDDEEEEEERVFTPARADEHPPEQEEVPTPARAGEHPPERDAKVALAEHPPERDAKVVLREPPSPIALPSTTLRRPVDEDLIPTVNLTRDPVGCGPCGGCGPIFNDYDDEEYPACSCMCFDRPQLARWDADPYAHDVMA